MFGRLQHKQINNILYSLSGPGKYTHMAIKKKKKSINTAFSFHRLNKGAFSYKDENRSQVTDLKGILMI